MNDVECPKCGFEIDLTELGMSDGGRCKIECDNCEEEIKVECSVSVDYRVMGDWEKV